MLLPLALGLTICLAGLLLLSPQACAEQDRATLTIVTFGDSTTAERDGEPEELTVYSELLRRGLEGEGNIVKVVNAGVGGNTTEHARARIQEDVLAHKPDLVVIQFGINDARIPYNKDPNAKAPLVPLERYCENLRHIIGAVRASGAEPLLMTPNAMRWTPERLEVFGKPPYDPGDPWGYNVLLREYADAMRLIADDLAVDLVDVFTGFQAARMPDGLVSDGVHLTAAGHRLVANLLLAKLMGRGQSAAIVQGPVAEGDAPVILREAQTTGAIVLEPDGSLTAFHCGEDGAARSSVSTDGGLTWSDREPAFTAPGPACIGLRDQKGEYHLFGLAWRGEGRRLAVDRFLDIWHCRTVNGAWQEPAIIFEGYVGAINGVLEMRNGRIILPFADWRGGVPTGPPTGSEVVTMVYSGDGGATWRQSDARLTAPCYTDFNGSNYGACEPVLIELNDGRVWMLTRTETGFLYESWSNDGITWAPLKPSPFHSTDSPSSLLRLPDGRILLFWNNCEKPPRFEGEGVYGGRDALHAAISDDEGKTWSGYREVYRDPLRNEDPPLYGDRGTAYPYAYLGSGGYVLLVTGQGPGRRNLLRFKPDWLLETADSSNYSDGLRQWHVFESHGPAQRWWRARRPSAKIVDTNTGKALRIGLSERESQGGAAWNFAARRRGRLELRLKCGEEFGGGAIHLTDRLFDPCDPAVAQHALFRLPISAGGHIALQQAVPLGEWFRLALDWDLDARTCVVSVNGEDHVWLKPGYAPSVGISYVHFQAEGLLCGPVQIM